MMKSPVKIPASAVFDGKDLLEDRTQLVIRHYLRRIAGIVLAGISAVRRKEA